VTAVAAVERCPHGDVRAACLECLSDPPAPPAPGYCWCGEKALRGRQCRQCKARSRTGHTTTRPTGGKRREDWTSARPTTTPPARAPFVTTRRAPADVLPDCPGCGLTIYTGQTALRSGGEFWHATCAPPTPLETR
jgi:hypothetical protein